MSDVQTRGRWWRLRDTPVPGGVPDLAKALLWTELAIVPFVSLGRSAVYSVVSRADGSGSAVLAGGKPEQHLGS